MSSVRCIVVRGFEFEDGDKSIESQIEKYRGEGFAVYIERPVVEKSSELSTQERVKNLMNDFGLNRLQASALLSASPRSLDNWVAGKPMATGYAEILDRVEKQAAAMPRRQLLAEAKRLAKHRDERRVERRVARKLARAAVEANKTVSPPAGEKDDEALGRDALREVGIDYSSLSRQCGERKARKLARQAVEVKRAVSAVTGVSDDAKLEMAALREQGLHYSAIAQRFGVATPVAYLAVREVLR